MKVKRFHQYVLLEKGRANTAIVDFLKGDIFQVENEVLEKFERGAYDEIPDFMKSLEEEGLILELDEDTWIPGVPAELEEEDDEVSIVLELEEGVDLQLVMHKFRDVKLGKIVYYGKEAPPPILPFVELVRKDKNFEECLEAARVDSEFAEIEEDFYGFNRKFNSCWGQKMAVTADGKIKPCIHSGIEVGDLQKDDPAAVIEKMQEYWQITKDKVEKCKDCELRYACFDCREIARREAGDLLAAPPYCQYDPYKGVWPE
jgi:radical SAM protein with 4Fe4S-binding SPASM domain